MNTQLKRRFMQTGLLAALVTTAIGGAGVVSAAQSPTKEAQQAPSLTISSSSLAPTISIMHGDAILLQQPVFQRHYLTLLVNTYAPDTAAEWKQALNERKQVEDELASTLPKPSEMATPTTKELKELKALPGTAAGVETTTLHTQLESGKVLTTTTQALPVEGAVKGDIIKVAPSEAMERQQKLASAVEAEDATAIRSLLPELLKDYKQETGKLRDLVKSLKDPANQAQPSTK